MILWDCSNILFPNKFSHNDFSIYREYFVQKLPEYFILCAYITNLTHSEGDFILFVFKIFTGFWFNFILLICKTFTCFKSQNLIFKKLHSHFYPSHSSSTISYSNHFHYFWFMLPEFLCKNKHIDSFILCFLHSPSP